MSCGCPTGHVPRRDVDWTDLPHFSALKQSLSFNTSGQDDGQKLRVGSALALTKQFLGAVKSGLTQGDLENAMFRDLSDERSRQ